MLKLKIAVLAAAGTLALATPSFAQNFQGFGASSSEIAQAQASAPTQHKAVALKAKKHVKAAH
jgi:hypothetical protein